MKKFVIFLIVFKILFADITENSNINVLKALNIKTDFINNKELKRAFKYYSRYKNRYFINSLENGFEIYPIIKFEIQKSNLPKELISVVMAESLMNIDARSDKRAVGLWQFIPSTAKIYGLKIDDYVDERRDPVKSTHAAIQYFNYLHSFFGKWYLAIMAYNAGEARVIEGVVRAKVDKLCKKLGKKCIYDTKIRKYRRIIWEYQHYGRRKFANLYWLYKKLKNVNITLNDLLRYQKGIKRQYLPKETRNYILKILAISFLFNNQKLMQFSQKQLLKAIKKPTYMSVKVPPGTSLYYISKILGMQYSVLREHNMQLKYSFTPPYNYYINIPASKSVLFYAKFNPKNKKYVYIYKVKKGDTLREIAKRFDIKLKLLYGYNKFGKYLHIGEKIFIPMSTRFITYKVKKGDSLRVIARKFGINYKKIMQVNALNSSFLRIGQVLKIPQRF